MSIRLNKKEFPTTTTGGRLKFVLNAAATKRGGHTSLPTSCPGYTSAPEWRVGEVMVEGVLYENVLYNPLKKMLYTEDRTFPLESFEGTKMSKATYDQKVAVANNLHGKICGHVFEEVLQKYYR